MGSKKKFEATDEWKVKSQVSHVADMLVMNYIPTVPEYDTKELEAAVSTWFERFKDGEKTLLADFGTEGFLTKEERNSLLVFVRTEGGCDWLSEDWTGFAWEFSF